MSGPLGILGDLVPGLGNILEGGAGLINSTYNAAENRKIDRRKLDELERNNKFARLLSLVGQSQGMQQQDAGAQRLLSLRNSGGI